MHRLLITYESSAVVVFSLNKDQSLFTLPITADKIKGKALTAIWLNELEILIGFEQGQLEIYRSTDQNVVKPTRVL